MSSDALYNSGETLEAFTWEVLGSTEAIFLLSAFIFYFYLLFRGVGRRTSTLGVIHKGAKLRGWGLGYKSQSN